MIVRSAQSGDVETLANLIPDLGYLASSEETYRRFEAISADPSYATLTSSTHFAE